VLTEPPIVVMLFNCSLCGRPQAKDRKICSRCYKDGKSLRGGICPDCGGPVELKIKTYCRECREMRSKEELTAYVAKRRLSGLERFRMMKVAEKAMKCDKYAQYTPVPTDEEIAAVREKFLALLAADVHCGTYGKPSRHSFAAQRDDDAPGGFGALANRHMTGGEAGQGSDRQHTFRAHEAQENAADRRR
jgi:hypothetical protein